MLHDYILGQHSVATANSLLYSSGLEHLGWTDFQRVHRKAQVLHHTHIFASTYPTILPL
jgi:hypothetical protein